MRFEGCGRGYSGVGGLWQGAIVGLEGCGKDIVGLEGCGRGP